MKKIKLLFLLIIYSFQYTHAQVDLNNGLVAYYPFNGNANDASGNNNNPIFNNSTLTTDYFGVINSAVQFNGISNYIQIPNSSSLSFPNTISLCVWVKPEGFYKGRCHGNNILAKGDEDFQRGQSVLRFDDAFITNGNNCFTSIVDTLRPTYYSVNTPFNQGDTPYAQKNIWRSLVYTYDGSFSRFYVDCKLISEIADPNRSFSNNDDLFLGRLNSSQFPYWFNGIMDEVRLYNRALNADEIRAYSFACKDALPCSNWLKTDGNIKRSGIEIGNLNITGNQITVECQFNASRQSVAGAAGGDLVSKHSQPTDINYLLRAERAEITTTNGYFSTPPTCPIELNKTYHVAMVYDGSTLKFYRNGFLLSQTPCTGNMFQNSLKTMIGATASTLDNNFTGFTGIINEVRIWNKARSQNELKQHMDKPLPNPAIQSGLQAYYAFENTINKQGNTAWNGTLISPATINQTNPQCTFIADSCKQESNAETIINAYGAVTDADFCNNSFTITNSSDFNEGDTVLIIQMKGATIDSSNTLNFGVISNYNNAGNYEYNYVLSRNGNEVIFKNALKRNYDFLSGKVQIVRVPYYNSFTNSDVLTCLPWDGSKGGVLVFNVQNAFTLNKKIDVSGKGFHGGASVNTKNLNWNCNSLNFFYPSKSVEGAEKGEGIADISLSKRNGKGPLANGGGGGNQSNAGGGGGSNIGSGGIGGNQFELCVGSGTNGLAGRVTNQTAFNKIFMGGGGGAGDANNPPPNSFSSFGGNGGGIVIISANEIIVPSQQSIVANGADGINCNTGNCYEGMGGGGGGGSILLSITNYANPSLLLLETKGGDGADALHLSSQSPYRHGPGGGGGGGLIWLSGNSNPGVTVNFNGGANGVNTNFSNDPWGATKGSNGNELFNLNVPVSSTPFNKNIDSIRISTDTVLCTNFIFSGLPYTNTSPIIKWEWQFGDGDTAQSQNTNHLYDTTGTFNVKLVGTDINGCKDSSSLSLTITPLDISITNDTAICSGSSIQLQVTGNDITTYSWSPSSTLSSSSISNPVATPNNTTKYFVAVQNSLGCTVTDSVTITVNAIPTVSTRSDTTICYGAAVTLTTTGTGSTYTWSPSLGLNSTSSKSPVAQPAVTTKYIVTTTSTAGCTNKDSVTITLLPLPDMSISGDTAICGNGAAAQLNASAPGAISYSWSPPVGLNNPNIQNPLASPSVTTTYTVTVTGTNGCKNLDSVRVQIFALPVFSVSPPAALVCAGKTVTLSASGGNNYTWSGDTTLTNINSPVTTATPIGNTTYSVIINENRCNVTDTLTVNVTVLPAPLAVASKSNDITCDAPETQLSATGGNRYNWSPPTGLDNPDIANPKAKPGITTLYTVTVTGPSGCIATDTIRVFAAGGDASKTFFVPSAFSPNGDGLNDCISLQKWDNVILTEFAIYNKWGNKVFSATDINQCWDGFYKGTEQPPDVYVYYIIAESPLCGKFTRKGTIVLIR